MLHYSTENLSELEWPREDKQLMPEERNRAVDELIGLVGAVDGILQVQSQADVEYFRKMSGASLLAEEIELLRSAVLKTYRWQYIFSRVEHTGYQTAIGSLITEPQAQRINDALSTFK